MLMAIDTYQFKILNRKKMLLYFAVYAGVGFLFLYVANGIYENRFFSVLIFIAVIGPFFIINYIRKLFILEGSLKITSNGFFFELNKTNEVKEFDLPFKNIASYKIFFPSSEFCDIEFILNDNSKIDFSFIDFEKEDNLTSSSEIISLLNKSIKDYNNASEAKRIVFKSSFIASKKGLIALNAMVVLLLIAISLHIITKQYQTIPVSLICGFLLLMRSSSQRKVDLTYYKEHIADGQS